MKSATLNFNAHRSLEYFQDLETGPQWDAEWNALPEWQKSAINTLWLDQEMDAKNRADYASVAA